MTDNMNVTVTEEDIRKVEMHVDTTMYDDVSLIEHFAASTGMAFIDVEREFEAKEAAKKEAEEARKAAYEARKAVSSFRVREDQELAREAKRAWLRDKAAASNEEAVMEALDEARRDGPGKDFVR